MCTRVFCVHVFWQKLTKLNERGACLRTKSPLTNVVPADKHHNCSKSVAVRNTDDSIEHCADGETGVAAVNAMWCHVAYMTRF